MDPSLAGKTKAQEIRVTVSRSLVRYLFSSSCSLMMISTLQDLSPDPVICFFHLIVNIFVLQTVRELHEIMAEADLIKSKATTLSDKRPSIKCDLRPHTPRVRNQKGEGVCVAVAVSDMIETTLKMHDKTVEPDLILSPQPLIDSGAWKEPFDTENFCADSDFGLESVKSYPYLRMEGSFDEAKLNAYKDRKFKTRKYFVDGIEMVEKERAVEVILANFAGNQFPLVGVMKMGPFAENRVAASFAVNSKDNLPYRPGVIIKKMVKRNQKIKLEEDEDDHALLIVGLDTTHEDPQYHYCLVKNSYGKKWGDGGFSRVGIEVFEYLYVPEYEFASVNKLREKEYEEERQRKLQAKLKKISPSAQPPLTKTPEPQLCNSQKLSDMANGESMTPVDDKVGQIELLCSAHNKPIKKPLDLEVDVNELRKCFLLRHLPMFAQTLKTHTMASKKEMEVVKSLDVERYMGRWYEIASFPSRFQPKNGMDTRATYTLNPDGTVRVLNETWTDGKRGYIEGTAYKTDPKSDEAKLKVKFYVPPFLPIIPITGDYWVLYIDQDYQYALIGQPSRNYLWILCRQPHLDDEVYDQLVEKAKEQGYDVSKLKKTTHSDPPPEGDKAPTDTKGVWWLKSLFGK